MKKPIKVAVQKPRSLLLKSSDFAFQKLEDVYGIDSYGEAFLEDTPIIIPDAPIVGFSIVCLQAMLPKQKAENVRDVQKGLRDLQCIDRGMSKFSGHSDFTNPCFIALGAIYAMMLMASRWDKEQQQQEIESNLRMARCLQSTTGLPPDFKIYRDQDEATKKMRIVTHATVGAVSGLYFGFSALQVAQLIVMVTHAVINPLPFVIMGFACAAVFCAKRLYDQHRLNLKKTISVLECELALNEKKQRQIQRQLFPQGANRVSVAEEQRLLQSLSEKEAAYEQKYQQLNAAKIDLNSSIQRVNNFLNVSQRTVSRIKNITLGLTNLASFASFTGIAAVKIAAGATLVSVLGGPIGIIVMATVVTAAVLYTWYTMRQRHRQAQQPAFQLPNPASSQRFKVPAPVNQSTLPVSLALIR